MVELLQGFVEYLDDPKSKETEFKEKIQKLREITNEFAKTNPKLGELLNQVIDEIEKDKEKFIGQDISVIVNQMRYDAIDKEIQLFAKKWFLDPEDVRYEAMNYKDGVLANENKLKDKANFKEYLKVTENPITTKKFKFRSMLVDDFREVLMPSIQPLLD